MRGYLFSEMYGNVGGDVLWFCCKKACDKPVSDGIGGCDFCVIDFDLPSVFECYSRHGCGVAFIGCDGNAFLKNAVAIFGDNEVCLWLSPEIESPRTCDEFVSAVTHTVYGYRNYAAISCGGQALEVCGWNYEKADCVNVFGCDYIFLKFKNRLCCFFHSESGYHEIFNIPATKFAVENGVCKVQFSPKISSGVVLYLEITLVQNPLQGDFKFEKISAYPAENYNFYTFENYFFELLLLSRFVQTKTASSLVSTYLCEDLANEISGILDFLGDYCGIVPDPTGGAILAYEKGENVFETRKFQIEVYYNKSGEPVVENIQEIETFKLPVCGFQDISKWAIVL